MRVRLFTAVLLVLALGACAKKSVTSSGEAPAVQGMAAAQSMLAYEHELTLRLPEAELAQRMAAVRDACLAHQHGRCSLLEYTQASGYAGNSRVRMRVVPEGVEGLVGLAAESGKIVSRTTRAEDLAEAVADTARQTQMLQLQRERLMAFQDRPDLSVADMLSLARELAEVESRLQSHEQDAAGQQRRLETNLLTMHFSSPSVDRSRSARIGEAFVDALDSGADGVAEAIGMAAYSLPFLILLFPAALLWRALWRRATGVRR